MSHREGIVIAIDGPAASGKSSTARAVASRMGYRHLDSGAFYRAITRAILDRNIPPEEWDRLSHDDLDRLGLSATTTPDGYSILLDGEELRDRIRTPDVNANVSRIAAIPAVRSWLLEKLREIGREGRLVADGRDIGTVVFPEAELKVFLVCEPAERARRRLLEQGVANPSADEIAAESRRLQERDRLDSERATAPLLRATDAVLLDTTTLDFDAQVDAIIRLVREREARHETSQLK